MRGNYAWHNIVRGAHSQLHACMRSHTHTHIVHVSSDAPHTKLMNCKKNIAKLNIRFEASIAMFAKSAQKE